MTTHLVWLRNDLRITDNKALQAACSDPEARVLAVFIATPQQWRQHEMAPRQAALIHASLQAVQQALAHKGIALHCHSCADFAASIDWLSDYCEREQVDALFYNRQYELNERRRDARLEQRLSGRVRCHGFDDSLLLPPGSVLTGGGEMYKVYTPFRNAFLQRLTESDVSCLPAPKIRAGGALPMPEAPVAFDYPVADIGDGYPAGEEAALQRLRAFCREQVQDYLRQRDLPALAGTSSLSPYLAIGVLSPRQCFNRLRAECPQLLEDRESGAFAWLNELIWREFYRHLLVAYPDLCRHRPFITGRTRCAGAMTRRSCRPGSGARPATRSSMPPCASSTPPAGCTTGCA